MCPYRTAAYSEDMSETTTTQTPSPTTIIPVPGTLALARVADLLNEEGAMIENVAMRCTELRSYSDGGVAIAFGTLAGTGEPIAARADELDVLGCTYEAALWSDVERLAYLRNPCFDDGASEEHSDWRPYRAGTKVTALVYVDAAFTWLRRTVTVERWVPEQGARNGYYVGRLREGDEVDVTPRHRGRGHGSGVRAVQPARAPRSPARPAVVKPDPATLPRIVALLGRQDHGEYGAATCPHCGAAGRYVYSFRCADGTTRGAMAGCIKLYPQSPLVAEHQALTERQEERAKAGRSLASWDLAKLAAIEAVGSESMSEADALAIVRAENARRAAWFRRR